MAEETDQTDKTEEPTAKRLEKAREEGQFLRSQDTSIAVLLISVAIVLYLFGGTAGEAFIELFSQAFKFDRSVTKNPFVIAGTLPKLFIQSILFISPILVMTVVLSIITAYVTGGIGFSAKAFFPKASKLNPITGLGRMFGIKSVVELSKSFAKLILIALVIISLLYTLYERVFFLNMLPIKVAIASGLEILIWGVLLVTMTLLIIAAIDLPYQIVSFNNKLKMSRQEIKDEYKESEGRPEVKAKIRERQRAVAMNQMMASIADADVIVTNPSHFAVALAYEPGSSQAPIVLAKGADILATSIREKAGETQVPIFESPYLARAIYFTTEINREIPVPLYRAVAEVIAYIFQLNELRKDGTKLRKPKVKIPSSMLFDSTGKLVEGGTS